MYKTLFGSEVRKFNPFHDEGGMFTDNARATFVSTGDKFSKFLNRARGMHTGPNHGAGYSGAVAAGINRTLGNKPNPDHKRVAGMKSHTVDANAKTKEEFEKNREDIKAVLHMDGFKHKGVEYLYRGNTESHMYENPNGAAARMEYEVQSVPGVSKWIGTTIFHGKAPPQKPVKKGFSLFGCADLFKFTFLV